MTRQEKIISKKQRIKYAVVVCVVLIIAAAAVILLWMNHIRQLRDEMESHIEGTIDFIERGMNDPAQENADEAMVLAQRLRDEETIGEIKAYIRLIKTIVQGNELFDSGNYQEANHVYIHAAEYASEISALNAEFIEEKIVLTERYITFYSLISQAESCASKALHEEAISTYEYARQIAAAIPYAEGISLAESGIEEMRERIILAKRVEAAELFFQGVELYNNGMYSEALECFHNAFDIYFELDDLQNSDLIRTWIELTEQQLAMEDSPELPPADDTQNDEEEAGEQDDIAANYEHNLSISFDLETLIDNQNQYPANRIRMGSTDGMNEGWYNGCGWVAVYNALILLGEPKHPAEIVKHFEESGGTVLDGVYGTYPNAIEDYLKSLGFNLNHLLLPQLTTNIDDAIKASRVSILAYLHTSAAHYITVEYREDIDRFIVYNDGYARARSTELGFQNDSDEGASIDSVATFINRTSNILISFSLITVL